MAWSSGSFSRVRGSASWTNDYNNNTGIEPGLHDTNDQDLAIGINNCLAKDGQNSATGNLDLGGNKLTNVGNATNAQDAVTLSQAQAGIDTQSTTLATTATRFSNDTSGPSIALRKSRGATVGTNTIVQSGDGIGTIFFQGANGTGYTPIAAINSNVDGTPGASSDMPGRLGFLTTADGSGTLTERMRIDSQGRVGIGTASPVTGLTINAGGGWSANNLGKQLYVTTPGAGSNPCIGISDANGTNNWAISNTVGTLAFFQMPAITDSTSASTERMRIDSQGRVGIGTNAPDTVLNVRGTSGILNRTEGTGFTGLEIKGVNSAGVNDSAYVNLSDGTNSGFLGLTGTNAAPAGRLRIAVGGTTIAYFTSTGLDIGTGRLVFSNTTTASGTGAYSSAANTLNFSTNGTNRGSIDSSGYWALTGSKDRTTSVVATNCVIDSTDGGIYRYVSSARYKTDIQDYNKGLEDILKMRPVTFKGKNEGTKVICGLIAEEVHDAGLTEFVMYDEENRPDSLAYQNIVSLLINGIKELNAKVESLEAQLLP